LTIHKVFGWLGTKTGAFECNLGTKPSEYFINGQVVVAVIRRMPYLAQTLYFVSTVSSVNHLSIWLIT